MLLPYCKGLLRASEVFQYIYSDGWTVNLDHDSALNWLHTISLADAHN